MQTKTLSTGTSITNTDNLAEMIIAAVKRSPKQTITYVGSDLMQTMSYQATLDEAEKMLMNLQDAGLKSGDNVVLALEKHFDNMPLLWACVLGGFVPCPITIKVSDTDLWNNTLKHISGLLDNPTFIIDKKNDIREISADVTISYGEFARPAYKLVAQEAASIIKKSFVEENVN
ncbi:peptide synthetase [Leuconostoc gelidum]|uniref:peptide synthetase n=1 Tax=Leuconostoc gelidum TaxID=1244 RepID=UPI001CC539BE|nr:peptide synthetase [Leuconostoc gelidum]